MLTPGLFVVARLLVITAGKDTRCVRSCVICGNEIWPLKS